MKKLSDTEQLHFLLELKAMLAAGLSIQDSLEVMISASDDNATSHMSRALYTEISRGTKLIDAMEKVPYKFHSVVYSAVRTGEQIGNISEVIAEVVTYLKRMKKLREKIGTASLYPVIVMFIMIAGLVGFRIFMIPRFTSLFSRMNPQAAVELTRSFNGIFISIILLIVLLLAIFWFHKWYTANRPKLARSQVLYPYEKMLFRLPLLRPFFRDQMLLQFYFGMKVLLANGISIDVALQQLPVLHHSYVFYRQMEQIIAGLRQGMSLATSFGTFGKDFPKSVSTWLKISEKTGEPQEAFAQLYEFQNQDFDTFIDRFIAIIEPVLTLLTGVILLVVVMQFLVPFYQLYSQVNA